MFLKIIHAEYYKEFSLKIEFNDGKKGLINLKNNLYGAAFVHLNEIENFKKFKLNKWTIEWENGADFAPEFLYDKLENISI